MLDGLRKNERRAMELAAANGSVSTAALAEEAKITKRASSAALKRLAECGLLEWVGTSARNPRQFYRLPDPFRTEAISYSEVFGEASPTGQTVRTSNHDRFLKSASGSPTHRPIARACNMEFAAPSPATRELAHVASVLESIQEIRCAFMNEADKLLKLDEIPLVSLSLRFKAAQESNVIRSSLDFLEKSIGSRP